MKFVNKVLTTNIAKRSEFLKSCEFALGECELTRDAGSYLAVTKKYLEVEFGYTPGEKEVELPIHVIPSKADLKLVEEFEDYLDEEEYLANEVK